MLKKVVWFISVLLLACIAVGAFYLEGFLSFPEAHYLREISALSQDGLDAMIAGRSPSGRKFLSLSYDTYELPVLDGETDVFLFCGDLADGILVDRNLSCSVAQVRGEHDVTLVAWNDSAYRIYRLEFTQLPIVTIELAGRPMARWAADEYRDGVLTVFDDNTGEARRLYASFKVRGTSSAYQLKKSYTIKLRDVNSGGETRASILGMDENTRFALNSLYEDDSKIRDFASMTLWRKMTQSGDYEAGNGFGITPAEVFYEGEYWGLYGFQEVSNRDALAMSKTRATALFKVLSHLPPPEDKPDARAKLWGDIELADAKAGGSWDFFAAYAHLAYYESDEAFVKNVWTYLNANNCADYCLLVSALYASDNTWKNTAIVQTADDRGRESLLLVPWDMDLSWGAAWDNSVSTKASLDLSRATAGPFMWDRSAPVNAGCEPSLAAELPLITTRLWALDLDGFRNRVATRWFELRKGPFSERNLLNLVNAAYDEITSSGARRRDAARWPEGALSEDNSFMQTFIVLRLRYLDAFFADYAL